MVGQYSVVFDQLAWFPPPPSQSGIKTKWFPPLPHRGQGLPLQGDCPLGSVPNDGAMDCNVTVLKGCAFFGAKFKTIFVTFVKLVCFLLVATSKSNSTHRIVDPQYRKRIFHQLHATASVDPPGCKLSRWFYNEQYRLLRVFPNKFCLSLVSSFPSGSAK